MNTPVYDMLLDLILLHNHSEFGPLANFQGYFATPATLPTPGQDGWFAVVGTTDTMWIWDSATSAWKDSGINSGVLSFGPVGAPRLGIVNPQANDYTWAMIDKTISSLADIATRSAGDLSSGSLNALRMPTTGTWTIGAGQTLSVAGADASSRFSFNIPILVPGATVPSVVTVQDILGEKMLLPVANLPVGLLPTGGNWLLASDLVINSGAIDADFTIKKLTSGDAYKYDAGADTHAINGTATITNAGTTQLTLESTGTDARLNFRSNSVTRWGIHITANDFTVRDVGNSDRIRLRIVDSGSASNEWLNLLSTGATFNLNNGDYDFTINKNTSGIAYMYDAGVNRHGWGRAPTENFDFYKDVTGTFSFLFESFDASAVAHKMKNTAGHKGLGLNASGDLYFYDYVNAKFLMNLANTGIVWNGSRADFDFTIRKLTSGDAYVYDAGTDINTFGSKINLSQDLVLTDSAKAIYLGSETVDGSWRFVRSGNNLVIERRESSAWVTKSTIGA